MITFSSFAFAAASLLAAAPATAPKHPSGSTLALKTEAARPALAPAAVAASATPASAPTMPANALAMPASAPADARQGWRTTGLLGLARLEGESGLALRLDAETELAAPGPAVRVGAVLSLGAARWSTSDSQGPVFGVSSKSESSTVLLSLVPAFRFSAKLAPRLVLYADTGLGLAYAIGSTKSSVTIGGLTETTEADASGVGAVLRFAAGGGFDVDPRLRIGAEAALGFHYGELRGSVLTLLAGATWRL
jgi:hypothetical protein